MPAGPDTELQDILRRLSAEPDAEELSGPARAIIARLGPEGELAALQIMAPFLAQRPFAPIEVPASGIGGTPLGASAGPCIFVLAPDGRAVVELSLHLAGGLSVRGRSVDLVSGRELSPPFELAVSADDEFVPCVFAARGDVMALREWRGAELRLLVRPLDGGGQVIVRRPRPPPGVGPMALSEDGGILALAWARPPRVEVIDVERDAAVVLGMASEVIALACGGGQLVAALASGRVGVWSCPAGSPLGDLEMPRRGPLVEHLAVHPGGAIAASRGDLLSLWPRGPEAMGQTTREALGSVTLLRFTPAGRGLISAHSGGFVLVRDVGSGADILRFSAAPDLQGLGYDGERGTWTLCAGGQLQRWTL